MNIKMGVILVVLLIASPASSGMFDDLMEKVSPSLKGGDTTEKVLSLPIQFQV